MLSSSSGMPARTSQQRSTPSPGRMSALIHPAGVIRPQPKCRRRTGFIREPPDSERARLVGGMTDQGGEDGDAPECGDRRIITAAAPRRVETPEDRRVGERLQAAADRVQGGAIVEAGAVEDGPHTPEPHPPIPPSVARARLQREGYS